MTLVDDSGLQYFSGDNIHGGDAVAVFSTRNGGVSGQTPETECYRSLNLQYHTDGDSNENVAENYRLITSSLGFDAHSVHTVHQVHSDNIAVIDERSLTERGSSGGTLGEKADALVTNLRGVLLSIRMADCVPVLLYDENKKAIAAVHSGWRGTFLQIAVKAIRRMTELYGSRPADVKAAIGPAIGRCCYEVDSGFLENFRNEYGRRVGTFFDIRQRQKPRCDLRAMNRAFLLEAGVPQDNIEVSGLCTMCRPDLFYSHRRSGTRRGTMAAFIGMK